MNNARSRTLLVAEAGPMLLPPFDAMKVLINVDNCCLLATEDWSNPQTVRDLALADMARYGFRSVVVASSKNAEITNELIREAGHPTRCVKMPRVPNRDATVVIFNGTRGWHLARYKLDRALIKAFGIARCVPLTSSGSPESVSRVMAEAISRHPTSRIIVLADSGSGEMKAFRQGVGRDDLMVTWAMATEREGRISLSEL